MGNSKRLKDIVLVSIFAAISLLLVAIIRFPIFPAAPFLEYDAADIPIFLITFALGSGYGILIVLVVSILQGLLFSGNGITGIIMHIAATGCFVLVAGNIYRFRRTFKGAVVANVAGVAAMTLVMFILNLIVTPLFLKVPLDVVIKMLPIIGLFNLLKGGINAFITMLLYKTVKKLIDRW